MREYTSSKSIFFEAAALQAVVKRHHVMRGRNCVSLSFRAVRLSPIFIDVHQNIRNIRNNINWHVTKVMRLLALKEMRGRAVCI